MINVSEVVGSNPKKNQFLVSVFFKSVFFYHKSTRKHHTPQTDRFSIFQHRSKKSKENPLISNLTPTKINSMIFQ
jgi:spore germination protein YaaH